MRAVDAGPGAGPAAATEEPIIATRPSDPRPPAPPEATRRPYARTLHGDTRVDPYHWLRDESRSDPEVIAHLEAENAYLEGVLAPVRGLRRTLYEEMVGRLKQDDADVPVKDGDYWYRTRYEAGREYPILTRLRGGPDGPEEILLDANDRAEGREFYALGNAVPSDDHRRLAIAEDRLGRGLYEIRIRDLAAGTFLPEVIANASGALAWSADGAHLFYVQRDPETLLPYAVRRHELGTAVAEDVTVHEEDDPTFYTSLSRGKSGDWIYIELAQTLTTELKLIPAATPDAEPIVFLPRERGHEYAVDDVAGRFFVLTNLDAPNFRLVETSLEERGNRTRWRELIAHREDAVLLGVEPFARFLAVEERSDGLCRVRVVFPDGGAGRVLPSDEAASTVQLDDNREIDSTVIRYACSSLTTPETLYEFDLATGERRLLKREPVLGSFDPEDYVSERFSIEARDGTPVPVSVVYRRPPPEDGAGLGARPLLVYGYGAYGASLDPVFSSARLSLLDRGFVLAVAHVRGGEELGRAWYDAGRTFRKQNTFDDFVAVTAGLIAAGYGDPARVYAQGASAGGLLVGAVLNQAPELYHGAIAEVPFVDVLTTMLDESIPLTTGEYDEWGDPRIPEQYRCIASYSPYDQVRPQRYPHLLVTTGLHDAQVQFWEPAKWVARLREQKTDDNLVLLHTDLDAGHGGASGRLRSYEEVALRYAFLLWLSGAA